MGVLRQILGLLTALLFAVLAGAPAVYAQTIVNTAAASWNRQGRIHMVESNTVEISVQRQIATIDTFITSSSGDATLTFTPSACGGSAIQVPGGHDGTATVSSLIRSGSVRVGDVLFIRLSAPDANLDPGALDALIVSLTTDAGDRETITIFETAAASGVFIGAIQTSAVPPRPVNGDCRLSVAGGDRIAIAVTPARTQFQIASTQIEVLSDPFGLVFDSDDGTPISGVRVSLVDALTGAPARVYADDGLTPWPASMVSGAAVIDGAGREHLMAPGEYRFPLAPLGTYRLRIEPPAPYLAPSNAAPAQLAALRRPDGQPFVILPASLGGPVTLTGQAAVRIDVPLDHPPVAVALSKTASRESALPGDVIFYTITIRNPDPLRQRRGVSLLDVPAPSLRLRLGSVHLDGAAPPAGSVVTSADGRALTVSLGDIAPGAVRTVSYAMIVRADASAGQAVNMVTVSDSRGFAAKAGAAVRIEREDLAARTTLVGRIAAGGCDVKTPGRGIAGVRVMLEDGCFAVTDGDGRYHFEGLIPGSHVVQALAATLPPGGTFVDCAASTRSAGSAASRFVSGQGGGLIMADFYASVPAVQEAERGATASAQAADAAAAARTAAGGGIDWLKQGNGPTAFLFPAPDHNPRAPAVRVAIRHRVTERVELLVDGKPVDPVAFEGSQNGPGGTFAVSLWRGIPLDGEVTRLAAVIRSERGAVLQTLRRDVHFAAKPARVELVGARSTLIADGRTRPVLALRILDRSGRPVHAGLSGDFGLSAPYESAEAVDGLQLRALTGLARAAPRWLVKGDDGIAYVELAPTMTSGKLHMEFDFADDQQRRRQELDAWIAPGKQAWMVTGLAEARIGALDVARTMEHAAAFDSDLGRHARLAFYGKGPVSIGKGSLARELLLTFAYDSAKQRAEQQLLGAIDPRAYYTIFADGSDRRFDAASREKLYLRMEGKAFTALYGDFNSGFDQTQLARYQRTATGLRGELATRGLHAAAFAAKIATLHRRDEFQGGGISGPYRLSSRAIVAGSEVVSLEVRDRLRSELIVSRRTLTRFADYDLDMFSGTITFREPILSRDPDLNPQFVVIEYELDETARGGAINAGLRTDYTTPGGAVRIGATALTDTSENAATRTSMGALDLRARIGSGTKLRAEAGMSANRGKTAAAWLTEVEHHSGRIDLLAYARFADHEFGMGQGPAAERGRRKFGLDGRYQVSEALSFNAAAWDDASLGDALHRTAVQLGALYRTRSSDARIGIATMHDTLADGSAAASTVLEGGITRRLLGNRLELGAASSIALGKAESIDLPRRHRLSLRYAISPALRLLGTYERAGGGRNDTRTLRAGIELTPWQGGRVSSTFGRQDFGQAGQRAFAAFGLAQSLTVSRGLTIDATDDGSRTMGGFNAAGLVNPGHPGSSGGTLGAGGTLAENFTAATLGGTWRDGRWSLTGRGEWRDGQFTDTRGITLGAIRQIGEGSMLGGTFTLTRAAGAGGAASQTINAALAAAHRPAGAALAVLGKFELRSDSVVNAVAGQPGPLGGTALNVSGNARSSRVIGSVALDWAPLGRDGERLVQRSEVSLFAAVRRNFDRYEGIDLAGTTLIGGIDARYGLGKRFELGARASVRTSLADGAATFSIGPELGFSPAKGALLAIGYNVKGYRDRDFSAARSTEQGLYAAMRFKFDAGSFGFLGLER